MPAPSTRTPLPTCSCGHDRYHHYARRSVTYGGLSWLLIFSGASGTPKSITFTCGRCGELIETTRDPAVMREFRGQ